MTRSISFLCLCFISIDQFNVSFLCNCTSSSSLSQSVATLTNIRITFFPLFPQFFFVGLVLSSRLDWSPVHIYIDRYNFISRSFPSSSTQPAMEMETEEKMLIALSLTGKSSRYLYEVPTVQWSEDMVKIHAHTEHMEHRSDDKSFFFVSSAILKQCVFSSYSYSLYFRWIFFFISSWSLNRFNRCSLGFIAITNDEEKQASFSSLVSYKFLLSASCTNSSSTSLLFLWHFFRS